jgi:outer membrane protein
MRQIGELLGRCSLVMLLAAPLPFLSTVQAEEKRDAGTGAEEATSGASDLLQLYQQAQSQDPRILAAQAAARRAGHQQREALGRLLPQMNADARLTRTNYVSGMTDTNYSGERYSASITQVLYDSPVWQSFQRSRALSEQADAQGENDIQGATADLVQRYFDVLAAQDSLELIQAEKRVVERNLERINSLYDRQLASITEKLEVEARLDRLNSDEIEAENRIWVAREGLGEIIGRPVYEQLERLASQPNLDVFDLKTHEYWRDQALATNPLMQARLAAVEAQRRGQKEAFGGHMPKVSLQLSSQKSNIGYENSQSGQTESNVAAISVQIPLFSGGSTQARSNAAYESMIIAQQELEQARRQVLREVRTAFLNTESSLAKVSAARVALSSAVKAREAAEKSFTFGINNAVDVLDRAREQYSAQRDLLEAQYSFLLSYTVLKRWSGTLNEEDLEQVNALLEVRSVEYAANTAG